MMQCLVLSLVLLLVAMSMLWFPVPHTNLSTLRLYLRLVACHVELYCVLSIVHYLHSLYGGQNH